MASTKLRYLIFHDDTNSLLKRPKMERYIFSKSFPIPNILFSTMIYESFCMTHTVWAIFQWETTWLLGCISVFWWRNRCSYADNEFNKERYFERKWMGEWISSWWSCMFYDTRFRIVLFNIFCYKCSTNNHNWILIETYFAYEFDAAICEKASCFGFLQIISSLSRRQLYMIILKQLFQFHL